MSSLSISPAKGTVGSSIALKATGLRKNTKYRIIFGTTKVGEFRTARGAPAAKGKFVIPEVPTMGDRGELGFPVKISVVGLDETSQTAEADFHLLGAVNASPRKAAVGYKVKVTANGLLPEEVYFVTTVQGENPDVAVAVLTTGTQGSGRAEFIVPNTLRPGKHQLQIKNRRLNYLAIENPPTLEIQTYSNSSLLPGKPMGPESKPYCPVLVSFPFKNNLSIPITATVYVIVYEKGRPRRISSSGLSVAPLGSGDAPICFSDLSPGKYDVKAFAATMTGAVLSKSVRFPLVIENAVSDSKSPFA